jgi:hypothetical protein
MRGFSTLEIVIALALMVTIIVGAVSANVSSQYWILTSRVGEEALYKAKMQMEILRARAQSDFQIASSTELQKLVVQDDAADTLCASGGLCYYTVFNVTDVSSCLKYVETLVSWRLGERYGTTSMALPTYFTNNNEMIAKGGDCRVSELQGSWLSGSLGVIGSQIVPPLFSTAVDVFGEHVYVTSSSSPQLAVYSTPTNVGLNPLLVGSSSVYKRRINAIDVVRDMGTGRTYAYVMQHASTSQLAVVDVTDIAHPLPILQKSLSGITLGSSFPQGWRVTAYGNRLYVTTRETAGPEFHVFDITIPSLAYEIVGSTINLNRTVNDMIVREQVVGGMMRRYVYLATSAALKELSVYDVTNDVPVEVASFNLPGTEDASSLYLTGNRLYLGRKSGSGNELYMFDVPSLLQGIGTPLATSEVGADVHTLTGSGLLLYLGTSKSGSEFQVWSKDELTWSTSVSNAGRISFMNIPHITPLGIDSSLDYLYVANQFATQPQKLTVIYSP